MIGEGQLITDMRVLHRIVDVLDRVSLSTSKLPEKVVCMTMSFTPCCSVFHSAECSTLLSSFLLCCLVFHMPMDRVAGKSGDGGRY